MAKLTVGQFVQAIYKTYGTISLERWKELMRPYNFSDVESSYIINVANTLSYIKK